MSIDGSVEEYWKWKYISLLRKCDDVELIAEKLVRKAINISQTTSFSFLEIAEMIYNGLVQGEKINL